MEIWHSIEHCANNLATTAMGIFRFGDKVVEKESVERITFAALIVATEPLLPFCTVYTTEIGVIEKSCMSKYFFTLITERHRQRCSLTEK